MRTIFVAFSLISAFSGGALASEKCSVAMAGWKPREALQSMLEGAGWKVNAITPEDGCYGADAVNPEGKAVEAYFNPRTLEAVDVKIKD